MLTHVFLLSLMVCRGFMARRFCTQAAGAAAEMAKRVYADQNFVWLTGSSIAGAAIVFNQSIVWVQNRFSMGELELRVGKLQFTVLQVEDRLCKKIEAGQEQQRQMQEQQRQMQEQSRQMQEQQRQMQEQQRQMQVQQRQMKEQLDLIASVILLPTAVQKGG
jgi:sensor histidine kinase YesM